MNPSPSVPVTPALPHETEPALEQDTAQNPESLTEAPTDAEHDNGGTAPRKRGRPPKPKVLDTAAEVPAAESKPSDAPNPVDLGLANKSVSVKRGRGRPRKEQHVETAADVPSDGVEWGELPAHILGENATPVEDVIFSEEDVSAVSEEDASPVVKRGRGRPKSLTAAPKYIPNGRPRGRPKSSTPAAKYIPNGRPRGRAKSSTPAAKYIPNGRPRGRPRKIVTADGGGQEGSPAAETPNSENPKRGRGRPKAVVNSSSRVVNEKQQERKLEHMQQKIKESLQLLKPHGDIGDVMTTIENLEIVEMELSDLM